MEYNSQMEELIIPEYGRNVQRLIFYAKTIEDDRLRQQFVEQIIQLMFQMQPQSRNMEDVRDKLWKHLFRIANYEIKVVPPNGLAPTAEAAQIKPDKVDYPEKEQNYRHYGNSVQKLIRKALEMDPGPKRDALVSVIASYMKLVYRTWNKEHFVSDDVIKADLEIISHGKLVLPAVIDNLLQPTPAPRRPKYKPYQGGGKSYGGGNGGGKNNKNRQQMRNKRK
ncbi:MAG: DUF4290 domain-containing protein [Haliscomenobacter sp.]|nr:DUF4290 domain-containing protein [Haliscomenobacter sp.]MBK7476820.1 DUF4290 domain-containing protein [Haliscomenobacter sp.]MBK8878707.1 DUF4290 domain-containing protein [Haliscomenobacter sp.]